MLMLEGLIPSYALFEWCRFMKPLLPGVLRWRASVMQLVRRSMCIMTISSTHQPG